MREKAAYDTLKSMDISRWQRQISTCIREKEELLDLVGLTEDDVSTSNTAITTFPVRVPNAYLNRIDKNNPDDPLLRQVLPIVDEDIKVPGYKNDPVGEFDKHPAPGLIQKYPGRVLLVTTSVCAIHCRYCFRRHYPYQDNHPGKDNWGDALDMIRSDTSIKEVILSGGDPLSLTDNKLLSLIKKLEQVPHLSILRIHTRMPVVLPGRVTDELIQAICDNRFKQTLVIHSNHANEINEDVINALNALNRTDMQLLNRRYYCAE